MLSTWAHTQRLLAIQMDIITILDIIEEYMEVDTQDQEEFMTEDSMATTQDMQAATLIKVVIEEAMPDTMDIMAMTLLLQLTMLLLLDTIFRQLVADQLSTDLALDGKDEHRILKYIKISLNFNNWFTALIMYFENFINYFFILFSG